MAAYHTQHPHVPGPAPKHRAARTPEAIVKAQCRDSRRDQKAWTKRQKMWKKLWGAS